MKLNKVSCKLDVCRLKVLTRQGELDLLQHRCKNVQINKIINSTLQSISHKDLVAQWVAQDHTHKLPVPGALDKLTSFTGTVGRVVPKGKGNPNRLATLGENRNNVFAFVRDIRLELLLKYQRVFMLNGIRLESPWVLFLCNWCLVPGGLSIRRGSSVKRTKNLFRHLH